MVIPVVYSTNVPSANCNSAPTDTTPTPILPESLSQPTEPLTSKGTVRKPSTLINEHVSFLCSPHFGGMAELGICPKRLPLTSIPTPMLPFQQLSPSHSRLVF